ncbi:MAG TPA: caspase family protein [Thermoanaerobaculia bacterium]
MKKALIVGISDYGPLPVNALPGVESAIDGWGKLLVDRYDFGEVRQLANDRATKGEIKTWLEWLFDGAESGDQLVFIFCGHGVQLTRRDNSGHVISLCEQGLVTFPERDDDLEKATLFGDELVAGIGTFKVPNGVLITMILDCCFAGGVAPDVPDPMQAVANDTPSIVYLSGTDELRAGCHGIVDGEPRMFFSYQAVKLLDQLPKQTYQELTDAVTRLLTGFQKPSLLAVPSNRVNNYFIE